MVVLAGSSDQPQESMGAFQEFPQVNNLLIEKSISFFYRLKQLDFILNMLLVFRHLIVFHSLLKK